MGVSSVRGFRLARVRVHILGSSGTYPAPDRPNLGAVVEEGNTRILADIGPGVLGALINRWRIEDLGAVVISHRHPDHVADIFGLFHILAYADRPHPRLPLFAPQDTIDAISGFLDADADHHFWRVFQVTETEGVHRIGDLVVDFAPAWHSVPSVVTRFRSDHRSLVYTGDTGAGGDWSSICDDADLLLAEASLQNAEPRWPYHLSAAEAGSLARTHRVKRLALTHIRPHHDPAISVAEAEQTFDRPVILAVPGATIDL